MSKPVIKVENVHKSYGKVEALNGISLSIEKGMVLGLLGPNGAGKTTLIKILTTLIRPDKGSVQINGIDLQKDPDKVRSMIGLTGQYAAVDEYLTGKENLEMIGRLYRLSSKDVHNRVDELLERFDLVKAGKRPVKTYSGGMRRRIDLAMSLIASPPVLFLDEPTTGLDPRSRLTLWEVIKDLAATNVTVLLTTQYMDEADHLSDQIVVIDQGKVIEEGTPAELKSRIGSENIELIISEKSSFSKASKAVKFKNAYFDAKRRSIRVPTTDGADDLKKVLQSFEGANVKVESLSLDRPTLDDVFLSITGHETIKNNNHGNNHDVDNNNKNNNNGKNNGKK